MTIKIDTVAAGSAGHERNVWSAMWRGALSGCPACGKGSLYKGFLKVVDACPSCGTELHHQRADDAPPYFTMVVVGHVVVGGVLALEKFAQPSTMLHLVIWLPLTILLSLWLLPRIKGALVGLQWAFRMHGFGSGPDPAEPTPAPASRERGQP